MKKYLKFFKKSIYKAKKVCYSKGKLTEVNMTKLQFKPEVATVMARKKEVNHNVKSAEVRFAEQEIEI